MLDRLPARCPEKPVDGKRSFGVFGNCRRTKASAWIERACISATCPRRAVREKTPLGNLVLSFWETPLCCSGGVFFSSEKTWAQLWRRIAVLRAQISGEGDGRPADSTGLWRKRVGVEPTIRPAKDRIAGFEGREGHRTPFASACPDPNASTRLSWYKQSSHSAA